MRKLWRLIFGPVDMFLLQLHYETQLDEYEASRTMIDSDGNIIQQDGKFIAHMDGVTGVPTKQNKIKLVLTPGKVEYRD